MWYFMIGVMQHMNEIMLFFMLYFVIDMYLPKFYIYYIKPFSTTAMYDVMFYRNTHHLLSQDWWRQKYVQLINA